MSNWTSRQLILGLLLAQLVGTTGCQATRSMLDWGQPASPAQAQQPQQQQLLAGTQLSTEPSKALTTSQKRSVQVAMARSLEKQGKQQDAIVVLKEVVSRDSRNSEAYHRLAVLHDQQGKPDKATEYYRLALKNDPKNAEIYCDFGYSQYLQRRWSESEQNLHRAIDLQHDFARAHNNLGLLLARTGKQDEALREFHHAGNSESEARCNLALAMMLEHRWDDADKQCQAALKSNPNSGKTREKLDHFAAIIAQSRPAQSSKAAIMESEIRNGKQGSTQPVAYNAPAPAVSNRVAAASPPAASMPEVQQVSMIAPAPSPTAPQSAPIPTGPNGDPLQPQQAAFAPTRLPADSYPNQIDPAGAPALGGEQAGIITSMPEQQQAAPATQGATQQASWTPSPQANNGVAGQVNAPVQNGGAPGQGSLLLKFAPPLPQ